ncbi:HoxN/HupN/NixA family nickel/cobalt transporter [Pseudarthrobacter sp. NPDC058329]|uniref:HoxN/HupN/NixA family nickel/cobalt transporter n=1 Tax=Pseudarthrobacter sp. NPDC058329 TaxID=3346448 RepID=UPI0036DD5A62
MTATATLQAPRISAWNRQEKAKLAGIFGVVAALHIGGIVLYLAAQGELAGAGGLAGAGVLAYVLGMRHAFDADHIAVIDDTTRAMIYRGRRPVGAGFFFAMGHSSVVVILALLIWWGAGSIDEGTLAKLSDTGGTVAAAVTLFVLVLVALLNGAVLRGLWRLWRGTKTGAPDMSLIDKELAARGLIARFLGTRARSLITSSWHLYPVGLLMGLGLETASEVTLLAMTASATTGGDVSLLAILSLPLLFAAGMSTFDTADSLIMTRLYTWSHRDPLRTLFFNLTTTMMTVAVAVLVAAVYASGFASNVLGWTWLDALAELAEQFELLGFGIAGVFIITWITAAILWQFQGHGTRGTGTPPEAR